MCSIGHGSLVIVRRYGAIGLVIAVASCNYDWTYRPTFDGGPTPEKDAGGDPNPAVDSGPRVVCSVAKMECPLGEYCYFFDRACGTQKPEGECREVGADCKSTPLCTCKQQVLDGCEAQKSGVDLDESGSGCGGTTTFKCGLTTCVRKSQVCVIQSGSDGKCLDCADGCKCPGFETCSCNDSTPDQVQIECK